MLPVMWVHNWCFDNLIDALKLAGIIKSLAHQTLEMKLRHFLRPSVELHPNQWKKTATQITPTLLRNGGSLYLRQKVNLGPKFR